MDWTEKTLSFAQLEEMHTKFVLYIFVVHDNRKCVFLCLFLQSMRHMEMDYVDVQKESINRHVEAMSWERDKSLSSFITQKARGNARAFY